MPTSRYPDSAQKALHQLSLIAEREVVLGPSLFRQFTCHPDCTACCMTFTLDYLPTEPEWEALSSWERARFKPRQVSGKTIYSLPVKYQECPFLVEKKCSLWGRQPLMCQAAPQVQVQPWQKTKVLIQGKIFSRWWRWPEGEQPQCIFTWEFARPDHAIKVFERFRRWAEYFGFGTEKFDQILSVLQKPESIPTSSLEVSKLTSPSEACSGCPVTLFSKGG